MYIVNLYGGPGSGKSTGAAYIFSKLKMAGYNVELVTEFAKDNVWENNETALKNQAYIFGMQFYRISRLEGQIDVVVTDSPLLNSVLYNTDNRLGKAFEQMVVNVVRSYPTLNYFIRRVRPYQKIGRIQTEQESNKLSEKIVNMLLNNGLSYKSFSGDIEDYDKIYRDIVQHIPKPQGGKNTSMEKGDCL